MPRALKTQIQACNKHPEPDLEKDGAGGGLGRGCTGLVAGLAAGR